MAKKKKPAKKLEPIKHRVLGERVLVRRDEVKKETEGGILLPGADQDKPSKGVVVAIGEGLLRSANDPAIPSLSIGETVVFAKFSGYDVGRRGRR